MKPCIKSGAACALLLLSSAQCTTDHDALAKRDRGSAGSSGAGGSAGSGGSGGSSAASAAGGSAGSKYVEPQGRNVLTFLHGVADAPSVAWCFARLVDGEPEFIGSPWPEGGLEFGRSRARESFGDIDLASDSLSVHVLAGDLSLVAGATCEEAVAEARQRMAEAMPELPPDESGGSAGAAGAAGSGGQPSSGAGGAGGATDVPIPDPPALRVGELPALPPGTVNGGYSYLLAAAGCLGGPWYTHPEDDAVCGSGYAGGTTLAPVLVTLSRESSLRLGLQAVHASRALGEIDVRVAALNDGADPPVVIARDVLEGVIAPRPPLLDGSRVDYHVDYDVDVEVVSDSSVVLAEPWQLVLRHGDLEDVEDGKNYAFVVIGARPGLGVAEWWNKAAISIVPSDP